MVEKHTIDNNPNIREWNIERARERLAGLKFLRTLWVCDVAGGPFEYTGKPLDDAHFEFDLSPEDFDAVAGVLADTLDHFGVPQRETDEVLGAFAAHKSEVTAGFRAKAAN